MDALEAFGFSISHDLHEAMRMLQGYARALREDFASGETGRVGNYIDRVEAISMRVDQMVTDLLEFARLSRAEIPIDGR